jgi:hypothetical protein
MSLHVRGAPFHYQVEALFSPIFRKILRQSTLIVPGGGCEYWRGAKGAVCPFCAFPAATRAAALGESAERRFEPWTLDADVYVEMFERMLAGSGEIERLAIFNGGSFLHESEIPSAVQDHVARWYARSPTCRELFVEARPDHVTDARLERLAAHAAGKPLTIGLGFETLDARLRNKVLRKGMSLSRFEQALATIRRHGGRAFAYVFLKPPGLSERAAYDETMATLDYLRGVGVDQMALSCAFVPPGTPLERLYRQSAFRPPWLWTIVAIARRARELGHPLSIGGLEDYPPPVAAAGNCGDCDATVRAAIDRHRARGDLAVFDGLDCACRARWRAEFERPA